MHKIRLKDGSTIIIDESGVQLNNPGNEEVVYWDHSEWNEPGNEDAAVACLNAIILAIQSEGTSCIQERIGTSDNRPEWGK